MVIPIYDGNPFVFKTPPYVSWSLIAINVAVFLWEIMSSVGQLNGHSASVLSLAFRPDAVFGTQAVPGQSLPWKSRSSLIRFSTATGRTCSVT